jgi:hypothetical protein
MIAKIIKGFFWMNLLGEHGEAVRCKARPPVMNTQLFCLKNIADLGQ